MSSERIQTPISSLSEPATDEGVKGSATNACSHCGSKGVLHLNRNDTGTSQVEIHTKSAESKRGLQSNTLLLQSSQTESKTRTVESKSRDQTSEPKVVQEIGITRITFEEWRQLKKRSEVDPRQSVLLVSSKANVRRDSQKKPYGAPRACATEIGPVDAGLGVPYRLAINSKYLLKSLGQCIGVNMMEASNVFVRPFKYLVWYEEEIKRFFKELEMRHEQAETEAYANHEKTSQGSSSQKNISTIIDTQNISTIINTHDGGKETNAAKEAATRAKRERDEFRCLLDFMDQDMVDIFDIKKRVAENALQEISFEHVWQLFKPGDTAYHSNAMDEGSRPQIYVTLHLTGGRVCIESKDDPRQRPVGIYTAAVDIDSGNESENEQRCRSIIRSSNHDLTSIVIDCFYIDFDGVLMGPRSKRFVIPPYEGMRPIISLPILPSRLHPDDQRIQHILFARGKQFVELATGIHKRYDGRTIRESSLSSNRDTFVIDDTEVQSEVIIDQAAGVDHFKKKYHSWRLKLGGRKIIKPTHADERETYDPIPNKTNRAYGGRVTDIFDDSKFEVDRRTDFLQSSASELLSYSSLRGHKHSAARLMLLPPRLYGFSLLNHRWFALDISQVRDIPSQSLTANFEDLVLPDGHRTLLQALVKNQVRLPKQCPANLAVTADDMDFSMDVVAGKGKGLIILLHGVPGVGKTSTAECVAAKLKRPLLPITCGDVGTTARDAELNLEYFCSLAHKWRNSLVSVFLRVLEYYSGVIILTTNRVGEFDEAFRSRIHLSLYYPKLSEISTKEIWERNISRVKASGMDLDIEEDKIRRFVNRHWERNENKPSQRWNGRQIKNAFQTVIALAKWDYHDEKRSPGLERPLLKATHFQRVAQTSAHFDDYIRDIHGILEEEDSYGYLAQQEKLRKDDDPVGLSKPRSQESHRPGKRAPLRPERNLFNAGTTKYRAFSSDDDLASEQSDDLETLKRKVRLKEKKNRHAEATGFRESEEEEDW
ncbi:hypothetical protein K491DRAFT_741189 [Lophiostoma macrostomum CBS 122681]|uniref:Uncharacterized protein n=1 Tax=Lophiostoma macrostomum CBS 122681 TaxID=1314788 RepID=A0A6A6SK18_9PLEO|nr:hypothetical protein K491DRAFT_741189 [Lophiostoma macrostomum CBS 122681]